TLFDVKTGSHQIKVQMDGYLSSPASIIIEVKEDSLISLNFTLFSLSYGSLQVNSNVDGADIAVDNVPTGQKTPYLFSHDIPAGSHLISIFKDGYSNDSPAKQLVNISTTDTVELALNLTPASVAQGSWELSSANLGKITPDFYLQNDYGEWLRLYAYRGYICIINFWATNCSNCMAELPYLQQLYSEYSSDTLELFALDYLDADGFDIISQTRSNLGLSFTLLKDAGGTVKSVYNPLGTPLTIIIDRSGKIHYYALGFEQSKADQIMGVYRQELNELFGK
ncbi:MAG TPA: redoxin domain-containing protein, partial [Terriglobales bacterium]|nr:redoxin domain-containing protein [Terriglobales bacterium]